MFCSAGLGAVTEWSHTGNRKMDEAMARGWRHTVINSVPFLICFSNKTVSQILPVMWWSRVMLMVITDFLYYEFIRTVSWQGSNSKWERETYLGCVQQNNSGRRLIQFFFFFLVFSCIQAAEGRDYWSKYCWTLTNYIQQLHHVGISSSKSQTQSCTMNMSLL